MAPQTLRLLQFESLGGAVTDARTLLEMGYERCGNWTLGEICWHLRKVQDGCVDGFPIWMSLFAPLRPLFRRLLLPRVLSSEPPRGLPTAPSFVPPRQLDDAREVAQFAASVERIQGHQGRFSPHPGFGRLDRSSLEQLLAGHAAHHLRFLQLRQELPTTDDEAGS